MKRFGRLAASAAVVFLAASAAVVIFVIFVGSPPTEATRARAATENAGVAAPAQAKTATPSSTAPVVTAAENSSEAPAAQPAPPPVPTRTEILNFDNWVVTCNEFAEGPNTRQCSGTLRILQQKTNQVVFVWSFSIDANKQANSTFQTPTGVTIAPGIEMRVGKLAARKIPFTSCDTGSCVATMAMDSALVREMTTAATAEATIQGSQGNKVQFNIQLKGFDRAYAALSRS